MLAEGSGVTYSIESSPPHGVGWERVASGLPSPQHELHMHPGELRILRVITVTPFGDRYPGPPSDIIEVPLEDLEEEEEDVVEEDEEEEELWKEGFEEQFELVAEIGR